MTKDNTALKIRLGICMAGAVSAGAYTAGVIDYLIEALDRWEKRKALERERKKEDPAYEFQIPMHDLEIVMLAGASAGGMTAAIAARALQEEIVPLTASRWEACTKPGDLPFKNALYASWVKLNGGDPILEMLATDDLEKNPGSTPDSLLNSRFLDLIAQRILGEKPNGPSPTRPYVSDELEVLLTLSNLSGITTRVPFQSGIGAEKASFCARQHRDFAHFIVTKNSGSKQAGRIPVNFSSGENLEPFTSAALATGAFPLVLKPRVVSRPVSALQQNPFLKELFGEQFSTNGDMAGEGENSAYASLNVDGGMLNNEPFDIMDKVMKSRSAGEEGVVNILLLIDPFPSEEGKKEKAAPQQPDMVNVLKRLVSALLQQNMVKADYMTSQQDGEDRFRFIMIPSKDREEGSDINGSKALASAALEGFSGFFQESFRHHDFVLGRINCKSFLQKYFVIPQTHFSGRGLAPRTKEGAGKGLYGDKAVVLPDLDTESGTLMEFSPEEEKYTSFPSYKIQGLDAYKTAFDARFIQLIRSFIKLDSWIFRQVLHLVAYYVLRNRAWKELKSSIESEFRKWGLVG